MVVERLLPQVDRLGVYLNGYDRIPEVPRRRAHRGGGEPHPPATAATPASSSGPTRAVGYVLTCDDDIDYPADYVARLSTASNATDAEPSSGFHGAVLHEPLVDYYRSRRLFHFTQALRRDTPVHVLGTGVAGYHTSTWTGAARPQFATAQHGRHLPRAGRPGTARPVHLPAPRHRLAAGVAGDEVHVDLRPRPALDKRRPFGADAARPARRWMAAASCRRAGAVDPQRSPATCPATSRGHRARGRPGTAPPGAAAAPAGGPHHRRHPAEWDVLRGGPARPHPTIGLGGTYVDVGAHYGNHTLYFVLECEADHVVAIEPNPVSLRSLIITMTAENGVQ